MILSLDPSSTALGAALFTDAGRYIRSEVVKPDNPRADSSERSHQIGRYLAELIAESTAAGEEIRIAIIEEPPSFMRAEFGNKNVQHVAFGIVYHVVRLAKIPSVIVVNPATWTRGRHKEHRAWHIRRRFGISPEQDRGNDAMDAIGLAEFWIARNPDRLMREERTTAANAAGA